MMQLDQAQRILQCTLAAAREHGLQPLAVIVLDNGGHPVAFAREDGASLFRHDIARAKAMGAIGMGQDSRVLAEKAKGNPAFFNSVSVAVGGNIALSPGGVLVRDDSGTNIGAVGVSGDTGDMDEACAFAGLAAAGFNGGVA